MTSQLLDRLEDRIDILRELIGPWNPALEHQESLLTTLKFLEKSIQSIYIETFHINEELFHILNQCIPKNNKSLDEKNIKYKMSLYIEDINLMAKQ